MRSSFLSFALLTLAACGGKTTGSNDDALGRPTAFNGEPAAPSGETPPSNPPSSSTVPPAPTSTPPDASGRATVVSAPGVGWIAVDSSHLYFATYDLIGRVPKAGGAKQELARPFLMYPGAALAPDGVVYPTSNGLARVPLTGGAPTNLPTLTKSWAGTIAADADGLFAQTSDELVRCTASGCATDAVQGSAGLNVAMDADWVYFRRATPGHQWSLVRAPRRDAAPGAYELLVDEVGIYGAIALDEDHVYFSRNGIQTGVLDGEVMSVSKSPGQTPVALASKRAAVRSIVVDSGRVYWSEKEHVYAVTKSGTGSPIVLGTSTGTGIMAIDATRIYWVDPFDAAVYAVPVPKSP